MVEATVQGPYEMLPLQLENASVARKPPGSERLASLTLSSLSVVDDGSLNDDSGLSDY